MRIPADVIVQHAGFDRWVLYNVFTLDTLGLSGDGVRVIGRMDGDENGPGTPDVVAVWEIGVFSNYQGLFADPTRRVRSPDDWGEPRLLKLPDFLTLLRSLHLLIDSDEEYASCLAPTTSLLDRKHAGNFHQQLGQHLLLERRENPEQWWLGQKFSPDLRSLGDNMYQAVQEPFVRKLIRDRFSAGLRIVDLGCGTGYYTRQMAAGGADVMGIDPNGAYLEHARAAAPERVTFRKSDIGSPGALDWIEPNSVDIVFMSDALLFYFVPPDPSMTADLGELFTSIRRMLRPSGRFLSLEPHGMFFQRPWLGDEQRPFTVVTEHRERRFNVAPHPGETIAAFVRGGFCVMDYQELYVGGHWSDARGRAFASTFPLWSYFEVAVAP